MFIFLLILISTSAFSNGQGLSQYNNTTTPLGADETYTGVFEGSVEPDVGVSCQTDAPGVLYFDFANTISGENYSTFPVAGFKLSAGIHEFHTALKLGRAFRIRVVNDSTAQTYLRCYTYFGDYISSSNSPLNQSLSLDSDAISVRSSSFQDEVRRGLRSVVSGWNKFGYRDGLTASAGEETVWETTGNYTPPAAASTMTISYDGTAGGSTDGAGTTGALSLAIYYLDENGLPQILLHTLETDGSDVTSVQTLGINRIAVASSGSATFNNSLITVTATTGGAKLAVIPTEQGVTQQAIYHVGSNHDGVVRYLFINVGKGSGGGNPKVSVKGYVYNRSPAATRYEIFRALINTNTEQTIIINEPIGFNLSPNDVLYFVADTDTNGATATVRFSLNDYQRN